ncbi:MAG: histidine phosphatase family protein [Candidatus Binatia bacterium]
MEEQKWVSNLVLVRHGESTRNLAKAKAEAEKSETYGHDERDMDVTLTARGQRQAKETGERLPQHLGFAFDRAFASPYRRTVQTAELVLASQGGPVKTALEERVREKEFGVLDGLTKLGIKRRYPHEAERKKRDGKYYYRPLGGESYPDVNQRVHAFLGMLIRECPGQNVLVVCHSVIVLSFRRLLERLSEKDLLDIDRDPRQEPKNCGVTWYAFDPKAGDRGKLALKSYNVKLYDEDLASDEPSRTSEAERRSEEAHAGKHAAQTRKQRAVGKKAAMTTKGRATVREA